MKTLRLLHRWTGGLIGLLLAILGFTGALLVHEDAFLRATVPHAADAQRQDTASLAAAATRVFAAQDRPRSIVLASADQGLHRLSYKDSERAAYTDQDGAIVMAWTSKWARPEVWLLDFHHHLFAGDTGKTIGGIAGLAGLAFVVTGLILWWPTRRMFHLRAWPRMMKRAAIVHHHRDLGVLVAPLLIISLTTGATMDLKWFSQALRAPFTAPSEMAKASAAPKIKGGKPAKNLDWAKIIGAAQARYPGAEVRIITPPAKAGGLISMRLRQQAEWLPNGRTMAWFDPADGRMVATRDAQTLPLGSRITNADFPLHAAKVGGLPYRLVMTVSGLALTLLGTLAVVTFWGNPSGLPKRKKKAATKGKSTPLPAAGKTA
ncbi:PepSY domain-containing protein [Caulobacter sp. RHG1]|uniref:PepSY-associated TM helix domain-containing protein n=1 Tax=Caulobacter sp. (strain RHG1) TaxID=2545762 RepID=UPI001556CE7A|nr:PepSY-associated TM helix domain-containing protein [Caulobacter sp. RHG1]NQE64788.1 putative iron-regulated membrane protein, Iron-uptake factor PiuB [Caulobacter sp. RHG1]